MKTTWAYAISLSRSVVFVLGCLAIAAPTAQAVQVSAGNSLVQPTTNLMGLPTPSAVFDPGLPDFGSLGLAAPGSGTATAITSFAYPSNAPNAGNAVQMWGDSISSITNLGSGAFQLEVTVTNFMFDQPSPVITDEYVYLNVWETFTGLGLPTSLSWSTSGSMSITGLWTAGAPGQVIGIEPIAIVYDPGLSQWTVASAFFGDNNNSLPGGGPLFATEPVNSLTPYVSGGNLTVGMQSILLMKDLVGAAGLSLNLPTSLHMSVTLTPVPEPSTWVLGAFGVPALIALARRTMVRRRQAR